MNARLILIYFLLVSGFYAEAQDPFTIRIEPVNTTIPGFHSGAVARSGNHIVLIGGRTNGLHGFSSNDGFERQYANNRVIVIDTSNWQSFTASLSQLPLSVADPLRSTNMQHAQKGNKLYMCGGFGWDSIQNKYVTFPQMSVIHIDSLINAVMTASPIASSIRQISDTLFRACGGELRMIGNTFYLVGGHNFGGRYTDPPTPLFTQRYLRTLRKFSIADVGGILSIQNMSSVTDSVAFHRRDMNLASRINTGNKEGLILLGGVFTIDNTPYQNPVLIDTSGHQMNTLVQKMNQYTAAVISLYDTTSSTNYHIIPGGISLYDYIHSTSTYDIDSLSPFVDKISILKFPSTGQASESVSSTVMPALLGSNMVFTPSSTSNRFGNDVIKLPYSGSLFAGYLIGGIRASGPNFMPSTVNDSIYKIYITYTPSNIRNLESKQLRIYPNPARTEVFIENALQGSIEIYDENSRLVYSRETGKMKAGQNRIDISMLSPGFYIIRQISESDVQSARLIISR